MDLAQRLNLLKQSPNRSRKSGATSLEATDGGLQSTLSFLDGKSLEPHRGIGRGDRFETEVHRLDLHLGAFRIWPDHVIEILSTAGGPSPVQLRAQFRSLHHSSALFVGIERRLFSSAQAPCRPCPVTASLPWRCGSATGGEIDRRPRLSTARYR